MDPAINAAVIGALSGLVGALVVVVINQKALRSAERRAQQEMEQRISIAKADLEARLAMLESEQKDKFKLAALDKRLLKHQEAFTIWIKFFHNFHTDKASEVALECEKWWFENCLFLEAKPRASFKRGLFHAGKYQGYPDEMKEQVWPTIEGVIRDITEAVDLAFLPDQMEVKRMEDIQASPEDPCSDV